MHPTLILTNGKIHTLASGGAVVAAIAIFGDEVVATGADDAMRALAGPHTTVHDLGGRLVLPGLTDAHCHFQEFALSRRNLDVELPTLAAIRAAVAEQVAATVPGKWILGHGWSNITWGGDFPTAADLDDIAPDHPVLLTNKSLHMSWVNSLALRRAGIDADTPDPAAGKIGRTAAGAPNGQLFESATGLVQAAVGGALTTGLADGDTDAAALLLEPLRAAQEEAWRLGVTGIHDFDGRSAFIAFQMLRARRELGLRVVKNIPVAHLDEAIGLGLRSGLGDDWLRIGNIKVFADGALGARTATMIAPYEDEPENYGMVVTDKEELFEHASRASKNGLAMTVHAIGDRANHDLLDVYAAVREEEAARGEPPATRRHRIEHVQILHPDDLTRLGQLDVIASMQPIHATSDMEMAERYWGARSAGAYAWRTQLRSGATLAFGSDAPVESLNPLLGIHAAVTRRRVDGSPGPDGWYPQQRLSVDEAVRAYTSGAAYAAGCEDRLGALAPGKLADLIVLDRDIYSIDPMEIQETQIVGAMVGGEWKYRSQVLQF